MGLLFNVDPRTIGEQSSPDNISGWDSMQHINLVTGLEEEFGVAFGEQQVVEMLSFGLIVEIVRETVQPR
jgi:acyl carrier protein